MGKVVPFLKSGWVAFVYLAYIPLFDYPAINLLYFNCVGLCFLSRCDYDEDTLNAVDNQGRTPLLTAAAYGKKDAIDCLCIDDEIMTQVDDEGRSALFLTVEAGHSVAVKVS